MSDAGKRDSKKKAKGKGRRKSRPESAMLGGYRNAMKKGARVRKTNERQSTNN